MRALGGIITAVVVAVLLTAIAPVPPAASQTPSAKAKSHKYVRSRAFDGLWSVVINTAAGNCGTYRAAVQIIQGQVVSAGGDFSVSGSVRSNGATAVTVSSMLGSAAGYGRLYGARGVGRWKSSGGECAGSWNAARRG
jgi:hypothetical protein